MIALALAGGARGGAEAPAASRSAASRSARTGRLHPRHRPRRLRRSLRPRHLRPPRSSRPGRGEGEPKLSLAHRGRPGCVAPGRLSAGARRRVRRLVGLEARRAAGCSASCCGSAAPRRRLVAAGLVQYARASTTGGLGGLRFAGTHRSDLARDQAPVAGGRAGFGGIVEGSTSRADITPLPGTLAHLLHVSELQPAAARAARGWAWPALARAEWTFVLGPRSATSFALEGDRPVDRLRRRHRPRRPRHRAADRPPPVVAAYGRQRSSGGSRGAEGARLSWAALALAIAVGKRARRDGRRRCADGGAPASGRRRHGRTPVLADAGARASSRPARSATRTCPIRRSAPPQTAPVVVTVKLLVDTAGVVQKVDVRTPPQPIFDEPSSRRHGVSGSRPRVTAGRRCPWRSRSRTRSCRRRPRPPSSRPTRGRRGRRCCAGRLIELGTRAPVTDATVTARRRATAGTPWRPIASGRFRLPLPPGSARVAVYAPSHNPFVQQETLAPSQELAVTYFVERDRYDPYEIVVVGEQRREEVSRITLRGPEIAADPRHVRRSVPRHPDAARRRVGGVAACRFPSCAARAPARPASCWTARAFRCCTTCSSGPASSTPSSSTRFSSIPAARRRRTGSTPGGIIDGRTARARPDEHLLDFDVNLLQVGRLRPRADPAAGRDVTGAARYGYPGFLLGLATNQLSLSYWDYQLAARRRQRAQRLDGVRLRRERRARHARRDGDPWRSEPAAGAAVDPRVPPTRPALPPHARAASTRRRGSCSATTTRSAWAPTSPSGRRAIVSLRLACRAKQLTLDCRAHGHRSATSSRARARTPPPIALAAITAQPEQVLCRVGLPRGALAADAALADPARRARRTSTRRHHHRRAPSIRGSPFATSSVDRDLPEVPPGSDDSAVWLKASAGIYHQPPRFVLPLPGPGHDAAQVRPAAVVPDQPRAPRSRCSSGSSSRPRATSTTWTRPSSICR